MHKRENNVFLLRAEAFLNGKIYIAIKHTAWVKPINYLIVFMLIQFLKINSDSREMKICLSSQRAMCFKFWSKHTLGTTLTKAGTFAKWEINKKIKFKLFHCYGQTLIIKVLSVLMGKIYWARAFFKKDNPNSKNLNGFYQCKSFKIQIKENNSNSLLKISFQKLSNVLGIYREPSII